MADIWSFIQQNWEKIGVAYLLFIKFLTSIRDILDKTPDSDDNWFEKLCTLLSKLPQTLLLGQRPE